jgi:hypothetical protein
MYPANSPHFSGTDSTRDFGKLHFPLDLLEEIEDHIFRDLAHKASGKFAAFFDDALPNHAGPGTSRNSGRLRAAKFASIKKKIFIHRGTALGTNQWGYQMDFFDELIPRASTGFAIGSVVGILGETLSYPMQALGYWTRVCHGRRSPCRLLLHGKGPECIPGLFFTCHRSAHRSKISRLVATKSPACIL